MATRSKSKVVADQATDDNNNFDHDGPANPNGMGATMRTPYTATAGHAKGATEQGDCSCKDSYKSDEGYGHWGWAND